MKLVLLLVVIVAAFTANCRDIPDGHPKPAFDIEEQALLQLDVDHEFSGNGAEGTEDTVDDIAHQKQNKNVKGSHGIKLRGKKDKKILTKMVHKLEELQSRMKNITDGDMQLKVDVQTIRDNQYNITKINTDIKTYVSTMNQNWNKTNSIILSKLNSISDKQGISCPKGFFSVSAGLGQCFKYFNSTVVSWHAAKTKCQKEGLVLAKPLYPAELRIYLVKNFGNTWAWIGARGTGSYVKWERDGTTISSSNSMWMSGYPSGETSSTYCLEIHAYDSGLKSTPHQPYKMYTCSSGSGTYALCELI